MRTELHDKFPSYILINTHPHAFKDTSWSSISTNIDNEMHTLKCIRISPEKNLNV